MTAPLVGRPTELQIRFARLSLIAYERLGKEPPADIKAIAQTPLPGPESGPA